MPPDKPRGRPGEKAAPDKISDAASGTKASVPPGADLDPDDELAYVAQLRRRRAASWRLAPLETGFRDPLDQRAAS